MSTRATVLDVRVVTGTGGGPDKTILNSPRLLDGSGYRMICAYMHPPNDPGFESIRARAKASGAPLISVPDRGALDLGVMKRLLEICRSEAVSIWHGHDYKSNLLGLFLRPFWPMRLVTTVHGWVRQTRRTPLYYGIDRLCLPHYERVICVSEDLRRRCINAGVPERRCILIENGIDTAMFRRGVSREEAKRRLGIDPRRLVVGGVGRLSPEKGFDLLIRAAERLYKAGHEFELLIAGEGDQADPLAALVRSLGIEDRVRLLGHRDEPLHIFESLDIFALSSLREGLPNVLLEAMSLEVPTVATRVGGVPRLIESGVSGVLVDPGDEAGLAAALATALADGSLRERMGRAGRLSIAVGFDFEARMRKIRALYDEILSEGLGRPASGVLPT